MVNFRDIWKGIKKKGVRPERQFSIRYASYKG